MPRRDVRLLIEDIQRSIRDIEMDTAGLRFETYNEVRSLQTSTERNFIIIGEAIRRMHQVSDEVAQRIDNEIAISGFRNLLIHEYEQVDNKEVWRITKESLTQAQGTDELLGRRTRHETLAVAASRQGLEASKQTESPCSERTGTWHTATR